MINASSGERSPARLFLDVDRSLTGRRWCSRLSDSQDRMAMAISQKHDLPELLGRVLAGCGVLPETCQDYLAPSLRSLLPDPSNLRDMDAATKRVAHAIIRGERIAIFGDYDVDGATSSALLVRFLRMVGSDGVIYIPDRIHEGYGPNPEAFEMLAAEGAKLIVCVDCGTIGSPAFEWAKGVGLDVVVFDHHQTMGIELPPALAIVNPNRQDDVSGLGYLCAVGIVFLAVVAITRFLRTDGWFNSARCEPDLLSLLDLVALGTVCDVASLTGLNRAFVTKGLMVMRRGDNIGIAALSSTARLSAPLDSSALGFILGPRINAGGRIGRSDLGACLLSSDDPVDVRRIAEILERLNQERKDLERKMCAEAITESEARSGSQDDAPFVLVSGEDWHPGIVGLIASRLKDHFCRPAIAISFNREGIGTGSCRSIPGVDLGRVIRDAVDIGLLIRGGGHAMAAGLSIEKSRLDDLHIFLREKLQQAVDETQGVDDLIIDSVLTAGAAQPELVESLARAGPFGMGNPEPCFAFPSHRIQGARIVGSDHVRCTLRAGDGASIQAIIFRAASTALGQFLLDHPSMPVHVAGALSINHWGGGRQAQLRIADVAEIHR